MTAADFARLARPWQWYKNLVVFVPIVFSGNLYNAGLWLVFTAGFFALCFVSSAAYTVNDVTDAEADRRHPQKKQRPVASGRVTPAQALAFSGVLLAAAAAVAYFLNNSWFSVFAGLLFASIIAYSLFLKNYALVDVHVIAGDFALRALAGSFLLAGTPISPWFILIVFFLALLLAVGRRKAELAALGAEAAQHKRVFAFYSREMLSFLTNTSAALVLIAYALYSFLNPSGFKIMWTVPIVSFLVSRYVYFIHTGSEIAARTEKVFTDPPMIAGIIAWLASSILLIYYL